MGRSLPLPLALIWFFAGCVPQGPDGTTLDTPGTWSRLPAAIDDSAVPGVCWFDGDGDGHGAPGTATAVVGPCVRAGLVDNDDDCDDGADWIHPGAADEAGDGYDSNCNGIDPWVCYLDGDRDGFGGVLDAGFVGDFEDCVEDPIHSPLSGDCDDGDGARNPAAPEITHDGIDQDCDGADAIDCWLDADGDEYGSGEPVPAASEATCSGATVGGDCDDAAPWVYPGANDEPGDGVDGDCDGIDPWPCWLDADGDDFGAQLDPGFTGSYVDCELSSDHSLFGGDCDDGDAAVYPYAPDIAGDGLDADCDGNDGVACWFDGDGDGFGAGAPGSAPTTAGCSGALQGGDCDDAASWVYPGAPDIASDGVDADCDGVDPWPCYLDADGDGFGASLDPGFPGDYTACVASPGHTPFGGDCNDASASTYPYAPELAGDGLDQDCDGGDASPCWFDGDGDGFGAGAPTPVSGTCSGATVDGDCDDEAAWIFPGAIDAPGDGFDADCDGVDPWPCYLDDDGDGFGATLDGGFPGDYAACEASPAHTPFGGDCDDAEPAVNPEGNEAAADGVDSDCDGNDGVFCWFDGDGDGFGAGAPSTTSSAAACGGATVAGDCDDSVAWIFPGAAEVAADGFDADCDGIDPWPCYQDGDGDGFGGSLDAAFVGTYGDCEASPGRSVFDRDCDDGDASVYPYAPETADDGVDQDCNGADAVTCFADNDGDGFGGASWGPVSEPSLCPGSLVDGDCEDSLAQVQTWGHYTHPGAPEVCDWFVNDCDDRGQLGGGAPQGAAGLDSSMDLSPGDGFGVPWPAGGSDWTVELAFGGQVLGGGVWDATAGDRVLLSKRDGAGAVEFLLTEDELGDLTLQAFGQSATFAAPPAYYGASVYLRDHASLSFDGSTVSLRSNADLLGTLSLPSPAAVDPNTPVTFGVALDAAGQPLPGGQATARVASLRIWDRALTDFESGFLACRQLTDAGLDAQDLLFHLGATVRYAVAGDFDSAYEVAVFNAFGPADDPLVYGQPTRDVLPVVATP